MSKLQTINVSGGEYSKVPVRLKAFLEDNPRAKISAKPHWHEDGSLDFETTIIKDQRDEHSPSGNGWAHYSSIEMKKPKSYEKLQTISKGRALADLGYLNNGEIATTEELGEFYDFKEKKKLEKLEELRKEIKRCKTFDELKTVFLSLSGEQKAELEGLKNEMKVKLGGKNEGSRSTAKQ